MKHTVIKIGSSEYIWLWVAIEGPESKRILGFSISKERNMLIAERFVSILVKTFGPHPISTDCERTWYISQACHFLKVYHHSHSPSEKNIILKELCST
jgi:putative transposase